MEITTELVKHLANLSRLNFTESELQAFKAEFAKTMEHIDEIQNIYTKNAKSLSHYLSAENDLRQDEVKPSLTQDAALKNAPKAKQGMFAVNKIIE